MTPNDLIAGSYRMAKGLVHRMVDDLGHAEFMRQPVSGANSAAWIVGHLALTMRRTATRLGATELMDVTPAVEHILKATGKPAGDQSDIMIGKDLVHLFDECIEAVIERVKQLPAEALAGPAANVPQLATNFAEGLLFGALHISMHSGQLSTIRRSLGKPPMG